MATADTSNEPRQPRRFEKNTNIAGPYPRPPRGKRSIGPVLRVGYSSSITPSRGNTALMLLVRRTCGAVLMLASLLAWADADTSSFAVTRFALTVAAVAGLGIVLSYAVGPASQASAELQDGLHDQSAEQQLSFSLFEEG